MCLGWNTPPYPKHCPSYTGQYGTCRSPKMGQLPAETKVSSIKNSITPPAIIKTNDRRRGCSCSSYTDKRHNGKSSVEGARRAFGLTVSFYHLLWMSKSSCVPELNWLTFL
ncbi:hypothetical protein J6590_047741 [Homalodisca vitripennis]|nr:hypothetical protein J6590_047741 [Homalodisca vitripennis]